MANSIYRADFIYKNLQIQQNVIGESFRHNVRKLMFLGSTCIYPRDAEQPMKEEVLLTSPLEYTNEPYAIAKIAGLKMCESFNLQYGTNYIAVMPTNLYGPNDNFDLERSHVLPAMIRKIHLAHCLKAVSYTHLDAGNAVRLPAVCRIHLYAGHHDGSRTGRSGRSHHGGTRYPAIDARLRRVGTGADDRTLHRHGQFRDCLQRDGRRSHRTDHRQSDGKRNGKIKLTWFAYTA